MPSPPARFSPEISAAELERRLRASGTRERADNEKRYLKTELEHLGNTVPQVRAEAHALVKRHRDLTHDELTALVTALWGREIFECRLAAVLLLVSYPGLVTWADLGLLEQLIRTSGTWALVDPLAGNVLGALVSREPEPADRLDVWIEDPDFWVRRAALLSNLAPLRHGAGFDRFSRYADATLQEREFFIRKAIGWVLRDTARRDPQLVYDWLKPRIDRASGVTVREAVKYLDPARREELLNDRRRRAGASEKPNR